MSSVPTAPRLLLLAHGRLESVSPEGAVTSLDSHFATELLNRQERHHQVNAWKHDGQQGQSPFNRSSLWGANGAPQPLAPTHFLSVVPGFHPGEFFYTLRVSAVAALLRLDGTDGRERRILHQPDFREEGICCDPASNRMVMAMGGADGSSYLALCNHEATVRKDLTGGDSVDAHPSFSRQSPDLVVYQSSGLARGPNGQVLASGPTSIQSIDLRSMEHQVLVDSPKFDHLLPYQAADGTLWFIRRPWKSTLGASPWRSLVDLVLIPWKLAKAIFGFLDAFTQMFGKDRLHRAGGGDPQAGVHEMRGLFLGQAIAGRKEKGAKKTMRPPADWVLVRRSPSGQEETIATQVGWFAPHGASVAWCDGQTIRTPEGEVLHKSKSGWIESFCLV